MPQKPSAAHWRAQHMEGVVQASPSGSHATPPQMSSEQGTPAQHSNESLQPVPTGLHWAPPQKKLTQSSAQQSVVCVQAAPSALQSCCGAHTPAMPQEREAQHVPSAAPHAWPTPRHAPEPPPLPPYPWSSPWAPHPGTKASTKRPRRRRKKKLEEGRDGMPRL
jgi:hypothetical protein